MNAQAKPGLLFLTHRIPWPLDKGEKIRGWHVLRHLSRGYRIHLGCLADNRADLAHLPLLRDAFGDVAVFPIDRRRARLRALLGARPGRPLMLDFYRSRALADWTRDTLARQSIDTVYIFSVAMAPYVLDRDDLRLILDAQDVDSEKWTEYATRASFPMRAVWAREGRTMLAYERRAARRAEATFFVSDPEARRFLELAPETSGRVFAIENGTDLDKFSPVHEFADPYAGRTACVFTGNMDYWPNQDAAIWFARDILPLLHVARPALEFWIVGANPTEAVRALARERGVRVTGRVDDVRPYVAHAGAVVCPLRIARGIQNKVLEGMAMGRPVVASPAAFEGVRAEAGSDLLVADGAAGIAQAVAEVLDGHHPRLGLAARRAMETGYAWPAVLAPLDTWLPGAPAA